MAQWLTELSIPLAAFTRLPLQQFALDTVGIMAFTLWVPDWSVKLYAMFGTAEKLIIMVETVLFILLEAHRQLPLMVSAPLSIRPSVTSHEPLHFPEICCYLAWVLKVCQDQIDCKKHFEVSTFFYDLDHSTKTVYMIRQIYQTYLGIKPLSI